MSDDVTSHLSEAMVRGMRHHYLRWSEAAAEQQDDHHDHEDHDDRS